MRSIIARATARAIGIASLALFLALSTPAAAIADSTDPAAYRQAVLDTLTIAQGALPDDSGAADRALAILEAGTGNAQREIIADLEASPPDFPDAVERLNTLLAAMDAAADTPDPALAQKRLRDVMAMHRYDALHQPQTWLDRLRQWFTDRVNDLINAFRRESSSLPLPDWVYYLLGAIGVGAVALIIFSSTRGRFGEGSAPRSPGGPRAPADYFDEADRLAAAGDRVGAIRALCAGVAATLTGERTWEGSPLTVREIFQNAPDPAGLRPLLAPFEAAVYGGRQVDAGAYQRALQVAAPFRRPKDLAA